MGHTFHEKQKLLNRVRRIKGQVEGIERALEEELGCAELLTHITSCRGAINGLLALVLEDYVRTHMVDAEAVRRSGRPSATDQLVNVIHSYFR